MFWCIVSAPKHVLFYFILLFCSFFQIRPPIWCAHTTTPTSDPTHMFQPTLTCFQPPASPHTCLCIHLFLGLPHTCLQPSPHYQAPHPFFLPPAPSGHAYVCFRVFFPFSLLYMSFFLPLGHVYICFGGLFHFILFLLSFFHPPGHVYGCFGGLFMINLLWPYWPCSAIFHQHFIFVFLFTPGTHVHVFWGFILFYLIFIVFFSSPRHTYTCFGVWFISFYSFSLYNNVLKYVKYDIYI